MFEKDEHLEKLYQLRRVLKGCYQLSPRQTINIQINFVNELIEERKRELKVESIVLKAREEKAKDPDPNNVSLEAESIESGTPLITHED